MHNLKNDILQYDSATCPNTKNYPSTIPPFGFPPSEDALFESAMKLLSPDSLNVQDQENNADVSDSELAIESKIKALVVSNNENAMEDNKVKNNDIKPETVIDSLELISNQESETVSNEKDLEKLILRPIYFYIKNCIIPLPGTFVSFYQEALNKQAQSKNENEIKDRKKDKQLVHKNSFKDEKSRLNYVLEKRRKKIVDETDLTNKEEKVVEVENLVEEDLDNIVRYINGEAVNTKNEFKENIICKSKKNHKLRHKLKDRLFLKKRSSNKMLAKLSPILSPLIKENEELKFEHLVDLSDNYTINTNLNSSHSTQNIDSIIDNKTNSKISFGEIDFSKFNDLDSNPLPYVSLFSGNNNNCSSFKYTPIYDSTNFKDTLIASNLSFGIDMNFNSNIEKPNKCTNELTELVEMQLNSNINTLICADSQQKSTKLTSNFSDSSLLTMSPVEDYQEFADQFDLLEIKTSGAMLESDNLSYRCQYSPDSGAASGNLSWDEEDEELKQLSCTHTFISIADDSRANNSHNNYIKQEDINDVSEINAFLMNNDDKEYQCDVNYGNESIVCSNWMPQDCAHCNIMVPLNKDVDRLNMVLYSNTDLLVQDTQNAPFICEQEGINIQEGEYEVINSSAFPHNQFEEDIPVQPMLYFPFPYVIAYLPYFPVYNNEYCIDGCNDYIENVPFNSLYVETEFESAKKGDVFETCFENEYNENSVSEYRNLELINIPFIDVEADAENLNEIIEQNNILQDNIYYDTDMTQLDSNLFVPQNIYESSYSTDYSDEIESYSCFNLKETQIFLSRIYNQTIKKNDVLYYEN